MDRNFLLAFALSFLVIALWMSAQPPPDPNQETPVDPAVTEEAPTTKSLPAWEPESLEEGEASLFAERAPTLPEGIPRAPVEAKGEIVRLESDVANIELSTLGATLVRWDMKNFFDASDPQHPPVSIVTPIPGLPAALSTPFWKLGAGDFSSVAFRVVEKNPDRVVFEREQAGMRVRKTFTLGEDEYTLRLRLDLENGTDRTLEPIFEMLWPATWQDSPDFSEYSLAALREDDLEQLMIASGTGAAGCGMGGGSDEKQLLGQVAWAGAQTRYFLAAMIPEVAAVTSANLVPVEEGSTGVTRIAQQSISLKPGASHGTEYLIYIGPKERERFETGPLGAAKLGTSVRMGFAWVDPLTRFFSALLTIIYEYVPNYGWAIIIITILVRVVTAPLMSRQMRSMKKMAADMQAIKPTLDAIKEKYSDDRQRMSEETMKAYREAGVNPFGMLSGCLPLFLQFPVFIGLFYALQTSISLRQAPFIGWINDLSLPEELFVVPGLELPVRVLPLIMGASMFLQQKLTPQTATDPAQQRMMMTVMPVMFTVLFYQFPSGLVLYWMVSNFLAIGHQILINRGS